MSNKRLIKSTGVIGGATFVSRALGFVRDILVANFFGTTLFAEAFVVAFRIPNLLRDLVGEGAANAAFVPVLTEYHATKTTEEFWQAARTIFYALLISLLFISIAGTLLAPLIVKLIAPGFAVNTEKFATTVLLTRIMFPFILLVGLVAYGMGVLNSLNHFAVPAFGPVLLNVSMISFTLYYMRFLKAAPSEGIKALAFAVIAGGILQLITIGVALYKKGFRAIEKKRKIPRYGLFGHPIIKRIWRLLIPRFFGSAVYQLSVIIDNIFSTFSWIVGAGAPAALWYSYRLFHLPLAIFGISLATVALPKMSKEEAKKDTESFKNTINFSLRGVFMMLLPASCGLIVLGRPIIRILFERGLFTEYSTAITDSALFFYSFGLFAYGGIKIMVNSFFSLGDTKTPVKTATVALFANLILNYVLMWPLKIGGLALATSISATFNFLMLYFILSRRIGDFGSKKIAVSFARFIAASIIMAVFAHFSIKSLNMATGHFLAQLTILIGVIVLSVAVYMISCFALGADEAIKMIKWILKKE